MDFRTEIWCHIPVRKLKVPESCDFSSKLGLSFDGSKFGLGMRGQRFAMIIDTGVVTHLAIEESGAFEVSNVESIIDYLKKTG